MLNIEYYKDKLVELCVIDIDRLALIQGQPRICNSSLLCNECLLNNKNEFCSNEALNWLFSEYEELEVPEDIFSGSTSIYIKSELLYDTIGEPSNAINLKNGLANCFDEDCLVELIDDVTLVLN